jgi:hypothetical protein
VKNPLIAAVRRTLPRPLSPMSRRYLRLLDRRLAALAVVAEGGRTAALAESSASHALARRFLEPLEGLWDDGDEELVRGYVDRWLREGEDPQRAAARALVTAARELAGLETRRETLWFFLWELESVLESVAAERAD